MATNATEKIIEQLRRVVLFGGGPGLTDASLLRRFAEDRDQAAFEALMRRHGPMVWGVCRRILSNPHDAEDAFQATFLVLVRKAATLRPRDMVGNWLYGVAHQTALRTRALNIKRSGREKQVTNMPEPGSTREKAPGGLHDRLDEELSRLPDKYRAAIVLCDLEGKTRAEAARQLGWPEGTVSGRLARGRAMLAKRLAKHGPSLSVAALTAELANHAVSASLPATLVSSTFKAAATLAAGEAAAGVISTKVAALMEGVLKTMLLTKLKSAATLILAVGMLAGVVGGVSDSTVRTVQAQSQNSGSGKDTLKTKKPITKSGTILAVADRIIHVKFPIELKLDPSDEVFNRIFPRLVVHQVGYADLNVLEEADVVQDNVAVKLSDLALGSRVTLTFDASLKNVVKVNADGGTERGRLFLVTPTSSLVKVVNQEDKRGGLYQVKNTKILSENGKTIRSEDLKGGMNVLVIWSAKERNTILHIEVASTDSADGQDATPPANEREQKDEKKPPVKDEKRFAFSMNQKPWNEVVEWMVDRTGLHYISIQPAPTGKFRFISPKDATYSLPDIIDIINEGLIKHQCILIRRDSSFSIVSTVEPIDPSSVPRVAVNDLSKRGQTEIVQVIVPLKVLDADRFAPEAAKLMGPLGRVIPLASKNQLVLQDLAYNLRRVIDAINARDMEKAKKK